MRDMETLPDNYRVYKNGAIFDKDKGRIVALRQDLAEKNTQITVHNTSEMAARRLEKKRDAIIRGANAVVAEGGKFDGSDMDFVEAVAEAQAIKALNPDDPKSTDAARFLLQEAGLADKQAQATPADAIGAAADLVRELAAFAAAVHGFDNNNYSKHEVIDADTQAGGDTGGEEEANGR